LKNIKEESLAFMIVIEEIKKFLVPVYAAIVEETEWLTMWDCKGWRWRNPHNVA
jgi:hypothetical protein